MRARIAVPALASIAVGAAILTAGCGGTPDRDAAASTAPAASTSTRVCSGRWMPTDLVVVNFSNASSSTISVDAWIKNTKDRNDRFTLQPKSAPSYVRCNGGWSGGIDLKARVASKTPDPNSEQTQALGWKNAATGSDVVYCCDASLSDSRDLTNPGDSATFWKDMADQDMPFSTTTTLESVRDGIPHFKVTFTDR